MEGYWWIVISWVLLAVVYARYLLSEKGVAADFVRIQEFRLDGADYRSNGRRIICFRV